MKKLIFLSIFIIVSFTTKAQTLEQTMDFIEANIQNYALDKEFSTKCSKNALQKTTSILAAERSRRDFTQIYMKDIKSVAYSTADNGVIIIAVVGNCSLYSFDELKKDEVGPSSISIVLLSSTPIEIVNRIIKAIKHGATLEGAILIDEDLFKD
ncbi:MAG: hypothetical protein WC389_11380 [Lutibacter sp.]|jgi:hypothetical protein